MKQRDTYCYIKQFNAINMFTQVSSTHHLRAARRMRANREHTYTNITLNNQRYRLLTREYQNMTNALKIWQAVWAIVMTVMISKCLWHALSLIQGYHVTEVSHIFVATALALGYASYWSIKMHAKLGEMIAFSTLNLAILFSLYSLLTIINRKQLIYPTLIFFIVETFGSIFLLRNRNLLMGKFLLMLQLLIIVLKLDDQIKCEWFQVFFGFLLILISAGVCLISMALFFVINVCYYGESLLSVKHIWLTFVSLHAVCFICCSCVPLYSATSKPEEITFQLIPTILTIIANGLILKFTSHFMIEITLFLCKIEKIISLVKIAPSNYANAVFIKKSDNWYTKQPREQWQKERENNPENIKLEKPFETQMAADSDDKCLICFELASSVIWMPCGHLAVCEICCDRMFQNKSSNCLLCKNIPEAIYIVDKCKDFADANEINRNYKTAKYNLDIYEDQQCEKSSDGECKDKRTEISENVKFQSNGMLVLGDAYDASLNSFNQSRANRKCLFIEEAYDLKIC